MKILLSLLFFLMPSTAMASTHSPEDLRCLALNIYHEARSEPLVGQLAVGATTRNRMNDGRWPNDICMVVEQKVKLPTGVEICQFEWFCDGLSDTPYETEAYKTATFVAKMILENPNIIWVNGATHFYSADYPAPKWASHPRMKKIGRIANHVYFREE